MAVITTNLSCELQEAVKVQYLKGNLFSQDVQANKISVAVYDGGSPASISGTVTANIIREDGGTVTATGGTISGNVVSITLPAAAYIVPGLVSIVIKVTASSVTTTIAAVVVNVYQSSTETAIDPGTIIPSVTALVAQIETAVASIPADYSSLWTSLAPAFSSSASYTPGQYVTYNGGLYICTTAHTGSWNASHFSAVNVGGELSRLNGAIDEIDDVVFTYNDSASEVSPVSDVTTGYIYNLSSKSTSESSSGAWGKYSISGAKTLQVTGGSRASVPAFSLCGAYDSSNNLLQTFGTTASTAYDDYEITTPEDTAYIIVNGRYYLEDGVHVLHIGVKEITKEIVPNVIEKEKAYTTDGVTVVYDAFLNNTTLAVVSSAGCNYINYQLSENEYIKKIRFSGKNGNSNKNFYSCTFYDVSDNKISTYGEQNAEYTNVELDVPTGTKRIVINGCYYNGSLITPFQKVAKLELYKDVDVYNKIDNALINQWKGKKITILGTSVAYGAYSRTNYINEAAKILGFSVFNTGVPGMSITIDENGAPIGNTGYSSVLSLAEYSAQGITVPVDTSDSHYYCSWERIFTSNANNTDLFIFACIPNNTSFALTDWESFNKQTWSYPNSETFADHRQTFLGGLLFLMDKMYSFKSDARMCLLIDTSIGLSESSKTAIETIAEYYNIPLIDLWGKIQTTPQMLTLLKSENGTNNHPSTYAHQLMGKMLAGELLSVF